MAARSSSWHRTGKHSGSASCCNNFKFLVQKEHLGLLGGSGGFLTKPAIPHSLWSRSWKLSLQSGSPTLCTTLSAPRPFLTPFFSAEPSIVSVWALPLRTFTDTWEWNARIPSTLGIKPKALKLFQTWCGSFRLPPPWPGEHTIGVEGF